MAECVDFHFSSLINIWRPLGGPWPTGWEPLSKLRPYSLNEAELNISGLSDCFLFEVQLLSPDEVTKWWWCGCHGDTDRLIIIIPVFWSEIWWGFISPTTSSASPLTSWRVATLRVRNPHTDQKTFYLKAQFTQMTQTLIPVFLFVVCLQADFWSVSHHLNFSLLIYWSDRIIDSQETQRHFC